MGFCVLLLMWHVGESGEQENGNGGVASPCGRVTRPWLLQVWCSRLTTGLPPPPTDAPPLPAG